MLELTTTLKKVQVLIDNRTYTIIELDGAGESSWREAAGGKVSVGEDNKPIITDLNLKDPEVRLLSLCLHDDNDKLVPTKVLQSWPTNVLNQLYELAQNLSGLSKESRKKLRDEAKNS